MLSLFFPSLTCLSAEGSFQTLTNPFSLAGRILVLPSRLYVCAMRSAPRPDLKGQQAACLQLSVEHGLTNPDSTSQVFSTDIGFSRMVCWVWSRDDVRNHAGTLPPRVIPEALARQGLSSGVRLVRGLDGYEGEIWARHLRVAHQWWPEPPDEAEWRLFLNGARTLGLEDMPEGYLMAALPEPVSPVWRRRLSWVHTSWPARIARTSPLSIGGLGAVLVAAPLAATGLQITLLHQELSGASAELDALRAASAEWAHLRREALDSSGFADQAAASGDPIGLVYALLELQKVLEGRTALSRINLRDGEIVISLGSVDRLDTASLVQKLETGPVWHEVRIDAQKRELRARLNTDGDIVDAPR